VPACTSTTFDMRGLAIDAVNNLAFVANGQGCVVQEFNADPSSPDYGKFNLDFNGVAAGGSDCGSGNGQFEDGARDIAVDGNHDVWVGDLGDFRSQVFDENGTFQFAVPNPPAPPPTGGFNGPRGVAFDPSGNMYVTDTYNERVEEFAPNGDGGFTYYGDWGERGDDASTFNYPRLMCWDPLTETRSGGEGALMVANTDSNEIVAWNTDNGQFTSTDPPGVVWADGAQANRLDDPYGVACDPATGYVYAANSNGKDIAVFDSAGNPLGLIGQGTIDGFVRGIWIDSDGSVWADLSTPGKVFHFASWSSGGALLGSFNTPGKSTPFGIAGDANYVYVAFSGLNEVAQYTRSGTLVGSFGGRGSAVGEMRTPQGLAFGPDGNLYAVEENNNRVSQWMVP
jgi:DNA-binding beta-propeller fold protein YncE